MKHKLLMAALAGLMLTAGGYASAQDLKPVKDKETKKYGYVAEDKGSWVIEPKYDKARKFIGGAAIAGLGEKYGIIGTDGEWLLEPVYDEIDDFKKNGLARIMLKDEAGKKQYGAANQQGTVVLPTEFNAVNIDKKYDVIAARRDVALDSGTQYDDKRILMWGIYAPDGRELVAPQFSAAPNFSNGFAMVSSADSNLKGVIDLSGNYLIPTQNFSIDKSGSKYTALTSDLVWVNYDENFNATSSQEIPGFVLPYDTYGDDVRAVTYKHLRMGEKLHRNELKMAEMPTPKSVKCSDLPIDWGEKNERFVRLGPARDTLGHEHSLIDQVSGRAYTIAAQLFEADGTLVGTLSDWGWIEGVAAECIIYHSAEDTLWAVMTDINNTGVTSFASRMTNYKNITASTVQGVFGLGSSEEKAMHSWARMREKHQEILKSENLGVTTYTYPEDFETEGAGYVSKVSNWPLLHRQFQIGEVYSCKPGRAKDGQVLALMHDGFKMHFTDTFGKTGIKFDGDEEIWWGPTNGRFIKLELIPVKTEKRKLSSPEKADMIFDDTLHSGFAYKLAVCMYEEDGSFLRCLGESVKLGFAAGDMVLLEDLGLVFTGYRSRQIQEGQKISFTVPVKQASVLSSLRSVGIDSPKGTK